MSITKKINLILLFLFLSKVTGQSVADKYGDRIELLGIPFKDPLVLCQILIAIFISIAFLQSGIDKLVDRDGNLDFLKEHFSNSIFSKIVPLLLTVLTIFELLSSLTLIYGVFYALSEKTTLWIFYGFVVTSLTITFLFLGQRIAKDYVGAAVLVPYFILIMLGIMSMY